MWVYYMKMITLSFSEQLANEWQRLNPKFVTKQDSLNQTFVHAFQEGLYGYFAPLLIFKWLVKYLWNLVIRRA